MTDPEGSAWDDLDTDTPNPARMYDYFLGGAANFAADRGAAKALLELDAHAALQARANRAFLRRAVRYLADQGVRQFLDLGSGIPTVGNVHEIAHQSASDARVVYVDSEPIAANFARQTLAPVPGAAMVQADIRDVAGVLSQAGKLLDFERPVAVLLFAVLHFVVDEEDVTQLVGAYRDRSAAGSWLALSHGCADDNPTITSVARSYQTTSRRARVRSRQEITALFDGYELVEPGVVYVQDWRSDLSTDQDIEPAALCGVARKK